MGTLTDTGPLVALVDKGQQHHRACAEAVRHLSPPLVTTWPCLSEAMYLLGSRTGWHGQESLWNLLGSGHVIVHAPAEGEMRRMRDLMQKYRNVPMALADASLVVAAETRGLRRAFTLDSDFHVYRANDDEPFDAVP